MIPFHVGVLTTRLQPTMTALTASTGAGWSSVHQETRTVWTPDGVGEITFTGTFTMTGPTHTELIESVPDTLWQATSLTELHHVGYWVDDLLKTSARLAADGFPVVACGGTDPASPEHFAYHRHDAGGYLELIDAAVRGEFERWWSESG